MEQESKCSSDLFTVTAKLTVDGMKATVVSMVQERLMHDLPSLVERATKDILAEGSWDREIKTEAWKAMQDMIKCAVKETISYNYCLNEQLKVMVTRCMMDTLETYLKTKKIA